MVFALIVLGPKRLPEAGRQVGRAIAEVRKWSQGFQTEIRSALDPEPDPPEVRSPTPLATPAPSKVVTPVEAVTLQSFADAGVITQSAPADGAVIQPVAIDAGSPDPSPVPES